ncbi:hypothetical protein A5724_16420 [Mycobacterium sp. ACS1612]|uniref:hypothetical protein n=1 Tax=Mycobacterium sp. ACS1612 TaxID=1834117 RepID=UPI0007FB72BB|nr:hypothetical protein [Mycobacterium sp. ACS1612]OBF34950.1 hypothetical protein A5724_16420 [Mycobacterium sp. ACS1612]
MTCDPEIYFDDSLTADQRVLAEESIIAIVESKRAQTAAALARAAEVEKFEAAINAPLTELIQQHPVAAEALRQVPERPLEPSSEFIRPPLSGVPTLPVLPLAQRVLARVPPYDISWFWHDLSGAWPTSRTGNLDGNLAMDARSGYGGADDFVSSHIGVGCLVRIDRPVAVELYAQRTSRHEFIVGAGGLGANATAEGGVETTFMRGSTVIMAGQIPMFRRRVSAGEDGQESTGWSEGTYPNGMGGRIEPGEYYFNVGIYTFTDYSSGFLGSASAKSLVQSVIRNMAVVQR